MKAIVFFVCLFSLLLNRNDCIYGSTSRLHKNNCSPTNNYKQQQKFTNSNRHNTIIENSSSYEKDEYLIDDEVEDKNTNNAFARKFKLLSRRYLLLPDTFILSYLYISLSDQLSISGHLLYRYITQRVLRI